MDKIARLARSPQGRKLAHRAQSFASSPEGQRKIRQVRSRLAKRR
jgi:hypothetical protein